jgi:hypothetical protein
LASLISWGRKKWDLKKAAIFPQALLRGNDRCGLMRVFPELQVFFVQPCAACALKRRIRGAQPLTLVTNIKTF